MAFKALMKPPLQELHSFPCNVVQVTRAFYMLTCFYQPIYLGAFRKSPRLYRQESAVKLVVLRLMINVLFFLRYIDEF